VTGLVRLDVSDNSFGGDVAEHLAAALSLQVSCQYDAICQLFLFYYSNLIIRLPCTLHYTSPILLTLQTKLEYLSLRDAGLEEDGTRQVLEALRNSRPPLTHLDLSGNNSNQPIIDAYTISFYHSTPMQCNRMCRLPTSCLLIRIVTL
jgi:Ran GTPase-activating protein (RanGAP) involved in mRNA processing and transport